MRPTRRPWTCLSRWNGICPGKKRRRKNDKKTALPGCGFADRDTGGSCGWASDRKGSEAFPAGTGRRGQRGGKPHGNCLPERRKTKIPGLLSDGQSGPSERTDH